MRMICRLPPYGLMSLSGARSRSSLFFFFNDTATTEIYTLSLHDALPIFFFAGGGAAEGSGLARTRPVNPDRSEEHTSELQSHLNLVCRLLLEKKTTMTNPNSCLPSLPAFRQRPRTLVSLARDKYPTTTYC